MSRLISISPRSVLTTSIERLGASISSLSQLFSLSFILPSTTIAGEIGGDFWGYIHSARRIVKRVKSVHAQEVRVEFKPDPVASLGCCLSFDPRALEACGSFEEALLTFPRPHILFHEAIFARRAGRWDFWSTAIKGAFPRLSERGLLSFPDRKYGVLHCSGHNQLTTSTVQPNQASQTQLATKQP